MIYEVELSFIKYEPVLSNFPSIFYYDFDHNW